MTLEKFSVAFCAFALFVCVGCGGGADDGPELGLVTGTVKMDGVPMANVTVTFTSEKGQASFAPTDGEGKYELIYRDNKKGAEIGSHTVTIETPLEAPPGPGYKDPIPAKYNAETTLTAMVKEGENSPFDFDLESK
ncbi:MAG: carboxypeptidase regulatory-like domain-containing protein [Planctomycetaceae bacterium]|nr:carboxypeptidase regulatory-like domain-containing protein [Planctomycetaceae bacterium]